MTPDGVLEWTKAIGILGAILLGGFAVFSPSWVWLRLRLFGWGGAILCGFGTVLLVSPIFRNIHFVVDTQKLELKLSALEAQLSQVHETVATITTNLDQRGPVTVANVDELNAKLQGIQKVVAALETAIPNVSSLDNRIKGFEQTAAEIDKNVKALNLNYWTSIASAPSNSDYVAQYQYTNPHTKMAYDFKGMKYRPFNTTGYPLAILAPDSASLPEYKKLMEALVKVPEYQHYVQAVRKTNPDVMKWVDFDGPKGNP
jgi:hypothetical protein